MKSLGSTISVRIVLALLLTQFVIPSASPSAQELQPREEMGRRPAEDREQQLITTPGVVLRGPIDEKEYIVGPGDQFSITLWAQDVQSFSATVTPEGALVLPGVAVVPVAGKTLHSAKQEILSRLSTRYRNIESSIDLIGLRQIKVNVLGHVNQPGIYMATALDRVSELILIAGGLREGASRRNIRIERRNGEISRADIVRYENTADLSSNPPILDGDIIHVPFAKSFAYIYGSVEKTGRYELVEGEVVTSLIDIAGGFSREAVDDTVEIRTFVDSATTQSEFIDISHPPGNGWSLNDGDQVYVRAIPGWREINYVTVEGEMVFPGTYGINKGTAHLSDILGRSGGLTEEASVDDAKLIRSAGIDEIDLEFERLKKIPVEEMTETEYSYYKTKSRERRGVVIVDFRRLLAGDKTEDVTLKNGDRISVPKQRETVSVSGQVANPGKIVYVPDKKYKYYIKRAGGYASDARKSKIRVIISSTGEWVYAKKSGVLFPGDVVWVPEKPERDWWELTKDFVQFTASIATIYLVVDQAANR